MTALYPARSRARANATKAQVQREATGARHRASADARLLQTTVVRLFARAPA